MTESCCAKTTAGSEACEISTNLAQTQPASDNICPGCGQPGKLVQGQTVKALIATSLRAVQDTYYYFCRTESCDTVYFSAGGSSIFTISQVRERVYQKEPASGDVWVCYCFRHTVADILNAPPETFATILNDIQVGIQANQCACDLRNPQGSCCLGNVRKFNKAKEA